MQDKYEPHKEVVKSFDLSDIDILIVKDILENTPEEYDLKTIDHLDDRSVVRISLIHNNIGLTKEIRIHHIMAKSIICINGRMKDNKRSRFIDEIVIDLCNYNVDDYIKIITKAALQIDEMC